MENPFVPTAGSTPPEIIGRTGVLDEFEYGLRLGSGAPGLLTIFTGARGIGKTVMLGSAEDMALGAGWAVISETATPGFMARIGEAMRRLDQELGEGPPGRRITALTAAGFGITTALPPAEQVSWRLQGAQLLNRLRERGAGLILTVDEIHAADRAEISQLAANVQHFIREGLPIGMVFAGLPAAVSDLLNEGVATFLRRADRLDLHAAAVKDVEKSYTAIFREGAFNLDPAILHDAAEATEGYPFLIQLVGYFLWREAELNPVVSPEIAERAFAGARRRNIRMVVEAALSSLSGRDLDFLRAMAEDEVSSTAKDIGARMGVASSAVGNHRARLLAAGLIEPVRHGIVRFALPGLREHLLAS
jgi:hypothetical protein